MSAKILGVQQYFRVSNPKILRVQAVSRVIIPEKLLSTSSIPEYRTLKYEYSEYTKYMNNLPPILVTLLQGTRSIYLHLPT